MLTVCADLTQWVFGRVRAPWCAKQRHRPEQSPRQLQLTLSIHRLAIVRHSDERQSRKATRQDSASGTRREWRPRTAANWASTTTANWRSRPSLPRATGAEAGDAAYRPPRGRGTQSASSCPRRSGRRLLRPSVVRLRIGNGLSRAYGLPRARAGAPSPFDRSPHCTDRSCPPQTSSRPCGSFASQVDGCPTCRRVASDPELAMTGARGRAADTVGKNAERGHWFMSYVNNIQ